MQQLAAPVSGWKPRGRTAGRLTWNLMGMMNNPHYRVKVHAATTPDGLLAMRFEHPCLAGGEAGGCAPGCCCHRTSAVFISSVNMGVIARAAPVCWRPADEPLAGSSQSIVFFATCALQCVSNRV